MKKTSVAMIVLAFVIAVLVLPGSIMQLSIAPDTTGHSKTVVGMTGGSKEAGAPYDLLDSGSYVTAWQSPGLSEKIVVQPQVSLKTVASAMAYADQVFTGYQIVVKVEGSGEATLDINGMRVTTPWSSPGYPPPHIMINSGWYPLNTMILKVVGPYIGKVHVELYGSETYTYLDRGAHARYSAGGGLKLIAWDEAELKSGAGSVSVPGAPVEEGTEITLRVTTAYSHSSLDPVVGGWTLVIYDNHGKQVESIPVADNLNNFEVKYTIPAGSFDPAAGANNNWKVVLRNELFDQSADYIVVVKTTPTHPGEPAKVLPLRPDILYVGQPLEMKTGAVLQYKLSVGKSSGGTDPVGFRLSVGISSEQGVVSTFLIDNQYHAATKVGDEWEAAFSFVVATESWYKVQANTIDSNNLGSGFSSVVFKVVNPTQPVIPGVEPPTYVPPSAVPSGTNYTGPSGTGTGGGGGVIEKADWQTLVLGLAVIMLGILVGFAIIIRVPGSVGMVTGVIILIAMLIIGGYEVSQFVADAQDKGIMMIGGLT